MELLNKRLGRAHDSVKLPSRWCFISGGGSKTQESTQSVSIPEQFKPGLDLGLEAQLKEFGRGPKEFFPGSTVVGFNPTEELGQNMTLDQATGALTQLASGAQGGANFNFGNAINPGQNPEFLKLMDDVAARSTQNFTETVLPQLRTSSQSAGGYGDSRQDLIQGRAADEFGEGLGASLGQIAQSQYNKDIQTGLQQQQLLPSLINSSLAPGATVGAVGDDYRGLEEANLNEEIQRFNFNQNAEQNRIDQLMKTIYGGIGTTGVNRTQTQEVESSNPLQSIMGIASLGASFIPGGQFLGPLMAGMGSLGGGGAPASSLQALKNVTST